MRIGLQAPLRRGYLDELEKLLRSRERRPPAHSLVVDDRLGDLLADREDGVECRHRLLEDHRDLRTPQLPKRLLIRVENIDAAGTNRSADLYTPMRQQAHDAAHRDALAGAGFTKKPEHLTLLKPQADAFDRLHHLPSGREADMQVFDLD